MKIKRILKWTFSLILIALVAWGFIAYWSSSNDCDRYATVPAHPIKAIVYCDYGVPSLKLQEIEKPVPNDDQILVRVRAASLNPLDWHYVEGTPYIMRIGVGLRKPKETRLGVDYAGTIEAVGKNVTNFKPGDEVYGGRTGAFAEYLCARAAGSLALKPAKLSFEEAASVPIAGITALRDKGKLQAGEKVLINGASGGVGTFAVQIAKAYGARVTGVCSTRNLEMVRSLGAEQTIDYTQADFTQGHERYDLLLDNVGNRSLSECRRVLTPRGRYVMIGGGSATKAPPARIRSAGGTSRSTHRLSRRRFGYRRCHEVGDLRRTARRQAVQPRGERLRAGEIASRLSVGWNLAATKRPAGQGQWPVSLHATHESAPHAARPRHKAARSAGTRRHAENHGDRRCRTANDPGSPRSPRKFHRRRCRTRVGCCSGGASRESDLGHQTATPR